VSESAAAAASARTAGRSGLARAEPARILPAWWPLPALILLAALLRLGTIGEQSFWYDEAFTPVHVLRASLGATLHNVVHTENTPPLWYVLEWGVARVLGSGVVALRLLSALAGIATVAVAWAIGCELQGPPTRRAAAASAALVATSPLLVWYSQEARAYSLFVLTASLALLCFARALHAPTTRRLVEFALTASLALLTHYFAVFLLAPMVVWLVWATIGRERGERGEGEGEGREREGDGGEREGNGGEKEGDGGEKEGERGEKTGMTRARARVGRKSVGDDADGERTPRERTADPKTLTRVLCAVAVPVLVGLALIPLILAQGGHGTQWIGEWALASRLEAIPQYYLSGYTGAALGHGVELLVLVVALAGVGWGLWCTLTTREERGAAVVLAVAASGVLAPVLLALLGADYLAPRNLVAAMVPVSVLLAIVIVAQRTGRVGIGMAGLLALAFFALTIDVSLSPRLQRGDWEALARVLRKAQPQHVITTVELGAAPLEYYLSPLHNLPSARSVRVTEIDETGYAPLRRSAASPPAPGFHLSERRNLHGLIVYRFISSAPVTISEEVLRRHVITDAHPEVLVPTSSTGKTA
jgi:Dolichyl-phosphate-mannose-protein mannosyltransferase